MSRTSFTSAVLAIGTVVGALLPVSAQGQNALSGLSAATCGSYSNFGTGHWDYFDPQNNMATGADPMGKVKRVENVHFHTEVEQLNRRMPPERLTSELFYTLRAMPNHPRALWAISRLEQQLGKLPRVDNAGMVPRFTADCFFERAFRFKSTDAQVWMVYGMHSHKRGRLEDASAAYKQARELGMDTPDLNYNHALLLADLKKWSEAKEYASRAYAAGMSFPGLKEKLAKAGHPLGK